MVEIENSYLSITFITIVRMCLVNYTLGSLIVYPFVLYNIYTRIGVCEKKLIGDN